MDSRKFHIIRLRFKSPLHLSRGRPNTYDHAENRLHSDTLKSAIFVSALQLGIPDIGENFFRAFRLSSAFPFFRKEDGRHLYFFPAPRVPKLPIRIKEDGEKNTDAESRRLKKLGRVEYLEEQLFRAVINGDQGITLENRNFSSSGRLAALQENLYDIKLYETYTYQHVTKQVEEGEQPVPFYVEKLFFTERSGLFFLYEGEEALLREKVLPAIRLMGDNGIGLDKGTGNGRFEPEIDKERIELPSPADPSNQYSLSLYCPTEQEASSALSGVYGLEKRGGYITHPANPEHWQARKKSVYMLSEGSVFPYLEGRSGKLIDLRPDAAAMVAGNKPIVEHPIWRDGQGLFLPANIPLQPHKHNGHE